MANKILLGETVVYTDTSGKAKAAVVIGTAQSVKEGTSLPVPQPGHAHLMVYGFRGITSRVSVPLRSEVVDNADFSEGGFFETRAEWDARVA